MHTPTYIEIGAFGPDGAIESAKDGGLRDDARSGEVVDVAGPRHSSFVRKCGKKLAKKIEFFWRNPRDKYPPLLFESFNFGETLEKKRLGYFSEE